MQCLTLVQKIIIETLHKEGNKQKDIASRAGCSQSSVSKIPVWEEAVGRKKCGRKVATTERDDRSLERIVRSNRFNNLVEIIRECQDHSVTVSRATIHHRLQEMGYYSHIPVTKPLLNSRQKQKHLVWSTERKNWMMARWTKVLFMDESRFCITFGNNGPQVHTCHMAITRRGESTRLHQIKCQVSPACHGLESDGGWWRWTSLFPKV